MGFNDVRNKDRVIVEINRLTDGAAHRRESPMKKDEAARTLVGVKIATLIRLSTRESAALERDVLLSLIKDD